MPQGVSLADLIRQRDKLNTAIAALRALGVEQESVAKPVRHRRKRYVQKNANGTFPAAILRYLTENAGAHKIATITDGLTAYGVNGSRAARYVSVSNTLKNLAVKGSVEQVGKSWQLQQPTTADHSAFSYTRV